MALLSTVVLWSCDSVKVTIPDVAEVVVTPDAATLLPGESMQLTARVLDAGGNTLAGREVRWTTSDVGVATVSELGRVAAVARGTASIRASVEGQTGSASVRVVTGPAIALDPGAVSFTAVEGEPPPPAQTVVITNGGAGTLNGLTTAAAYAAGAEGWLDASLSTTTAPAQLRLSAAVEGLVPGTYRATITVASPAADNSPVTLPVTLAVSEQPPSIGLAPASVGFGAIEGESDPNPRQVEITNQGGGSLVGLTREIVYGSGPQGWLEATLSASEAPTTLTLQARTGSLTEGTYSASVRVRAPAAANSPQDVDVSFTVGRPPPTDVALVKTGPSTADAATEIDYLIEVTNVGPALAVGVVVIDTLPEGVRLVETTGNGTAEGRVVTWPPIESIAVGEAVTRRVRVRVPSTGELLNVAASTATTEDPVSENNDGSSAQHRVLTSIRELADLVVQKTGPGSVDAAAPLAYTITVRNDGPSDAIDVVVSDTFPGDLVFDSATAGVTPSGGVLTWPAIGTLEAGESATFTVYATAPANAPPSGDVTNVAAAASDTDDPDPANNRASQTTTVVELTDLGVTKSASANTVTAGTPLTYTLTATNDGPSDASGVTVSDVLPTELIHVSDTPSQGSFSPATGSWTVGVLGAGQSATLNVVTNVDPGASGEVVNAVSISGNETDRNPANDAASVSTAVVRSADLSVTKTDSPDPVAAGGTLTYVVQVTNGGPSSATAVRATESLPGGVTVTSTNATQGGYDGGTAVWTVGSLDPGATATLTLAVAVDPSASGPLVNSVTVDGTEPDPDGSDDTANTSTSVAQRTDLAVTVADSPDPVAPGGTLDYRIQVVNGGPSDASGVSVSVSLSGDVTYASDAATQGSYASDTGSWSVGSLASGASATLDLSVTVDAGAAGPILVSATVSGSETDPEGSNDSAAGSTTVLPPAAPSGLSASAPSSSQIDLAWTDNSSNESRFEVERSANGGATWSPVTSSPANSTAYTDGSVNDGTEYTYRVRACNAASCSGFSPTASAATPLSAPSGLSATPVSGSRIDLSWSDNSAAESGYEIERRVGGGSFAPLTTTSANATTFSDLTATDGLTYDYRARAVNAAGQSAYSNTASATAPLGAPSGLAATPVSSSQVDLSWTDNSASETGFEIERRPSGGSFSLLTPTAANSTAYSDGTVSDGTAYQYRVRAVNAGSNSSYSNTSSATTPLDAPSGLTATAISFDQIDLSWADNSASETGYQIERRVSGGSFSLLSTTAANATSHSDLTVDDQTTYDYRVRAANGTGESAYSNTASAATPLGPPAPPSGLSASTVSSSQVDLSWTDASDSETGFEIERRPSGGSYSLLTTTAADATSYSDASVADGTAYQYRVRAINGAGPSGYSNTSSATTPLDAPSGLTATAISFGQIDLSWTDNSATETGYQVERRVSGGSFALITTTGAGATSYSDLAVDDQTSYEYRVRAVNGTGVSGYSNTASATTPLGPPAPPSGLSATPVSSSQVDLSWTDASDSETGFEIQRRLSGGSFALLTTTAADATSFSDVTVAAASVYEYRVRAVNDAGSSGYSNVAQATTPP
jgi:uncharacterized repeat protein (TIGR01451 family)